MTWWPPTSTGSGSARFLAVQGDQLRERNEAESAFFQATDDVGNGGYGVGTVGSGEGVGVLAVVQDAVLDHPRRRAVPVPGHDRPSHAPQAQLSGGRHDLRAVPAVGDAEQVGEDAGGVVYGLLAALQLVAHRARTAPGQVRVGKGVVPDGVPGGDLGGEVRFPAHVFADHEEGGADPLALQDTEQLLRVWTAGAVVEGQGDHAFFGTGVPEDLTVEPGSGREPLVGNEPSCRNGEAGCTQSGCGEQWSSSGRSKTGQDRASGGRSGDCLPGVRPGVPQGMPARMSSAADLAECGRWASRAEATIRRRWSALVRILSVSPRMSELLRTMTPAP